ncbi:iojap-like ribosome-associated protein [Borreliella burgdorferi CA382]|uniref:ribosome silencing factor n=2 Tax=Borreliella burgdorferi TaxID=139 RepID=UPI00038471AE|nr:ribosome silencing factor [Borreliella burgdorferi]AGS66780.1 iojap-like ribosome-associated protein [Borreliella burgdorferi CA382]MCD2378581.1 ribosome silencing factor [Borreliella burgdorferi]
MEGMLKVNDINDLCKIISDFNGIDVIGINVSDICNWTDFFIIATFVSFKQMEALYIDKIIKFFKEKKINLNAEGKGLVYDWTVVSGANLVIHLMSEKSREYYELEKIWSKGIIIYP